MPNPPPGVGGCCGIFQHHNIINACPAISNGYCVSEISSDQLTQVVESRHGGRAYYLQSVPVLEKHGDMTVWEGTVAVFELKDQPDGHFRAYAWSSEVAKGKNQFVTVLHTPQIVNPRQAVRAACQPRPCSCARICGVIL